LNKNQVLERLRGRFKDNGLDESVMDWEHEYSDDISPSENLTILTEKVDNLIGTEMKEIVNELRSEKYGNLQREAFNDWIQENPMELKKVKDLFKKPKIISLIGDVNSGKSNTLYYFVKILKEEYDFNLFTYGLRYDLGERKIYSIEELEKIKNSIIILDEFTSLFDLEDRKKKKLVERTLRLIAHNNNVVVLAGLPSNFIKFIASKINIFIYGKSNINDFVNGSKTKEICLSYMGSELGSAVLNLPVSQLLVFDGEHYQKLKIPYLSEFDSKSKNVDILVPKNVR